MSKNKNASIDINAAAKQTILLLAQKNKTWKRLSSIVDLASSASPLASPPLTSTLTSPSTSVTTTTTTVTKKHSTIADIGCDHGLLSIALAVSGRYDKVIGIDVSSRALEDGALTFHRKVLDILGRDNYSNDNDNQQNGGGDGDGDCGPNNNDKKNILFGSSILPLEFRLGDGLTPLRSGEADAICIAGMGVESMLSILNLTNEEGDDSDDDCNKNHYLKNLNCQTLYLQPPKNRPKHLMALYKALQENNEWLLIDERIVRVKKRWYVTCAFERVIEADRHCIEDNSARFRLPGHFLSTNSNDKEEFRRYMQHHLDWLSNDLKIKGHLSEEEMLWMNQFKEVP
mmetsp:Transcript_2472/g.3528  ORF Transcript_2472/g.3528 Transcript_2472/m.3528 type:complete len:343 (+) Transcript_2472:394-1422(+)|eukprot:CAMPEP_0203663522 /NCGR_PEP_ID=MMETSP0090-20130426/1107_1 /ASSEMBLY_ACC=CAM_ASM_001088 /TAXON_ID=426623 /ORGANISM="Chaetoceros affinis, Strain CCMP159" /LENGTH=342 /DNA_ID=CAMNT_0050526463 /DNA_START=774 /DNA_END=1802 /DNA_ORIENTATION=-